jgi:hypothetical protein
VAKIASAVKRFKTFHKKAPNRIGSVDFRIPKALVYLGKGVAIEYLSDKFALGSRRERLYRHKFGAGVKLYTCPQGRKLFVFGGRLRVTDWLRY